MRTLFLLPLVMMGAALPAAAQAPAFTWETHASEAGARRYRLYVPTTYTGEKPVPLVLMLHGCTQDPDDLAAGTRMNARAEAEGFLVAYPEQTATEHPQKCWSWYDPAHQERGSGEPEILAGITRRVMETHRVDRSRVSVAGISAGGAMALVLAAAYPELYTAAAVHSALPYRAARGVQQALQVMKSGGEPPPLPGRAVPLLVVHGAEDAVVHPVNATQLVRQWTAAGGERPVVEEWIVPGVGHAWSGGAPEGSYTDPRGPDATARIVRFLLSHAR
jgi:poly(hydroxyalkanoate) depolymerase family esterase